MDDKKYLTIVAHYESCLEKYGDSLLRGGLAKPT